MTEENEDLEKAIKAGFLAILTVAVQIRDGKKATNPSDKEIADARQLLYKVSGYV
jgi:hypothetical protein